MQTLAINLCLALAVLFGSVGSVLGADFQKGLDAAKAGNYETAVKEFTALAKDGNASAQYNLGQFYRRGLGVTKDYGEAAMWYLRAAEQGHNKAQYNLGKMYRRGHGVSQDDAEAVKWYRRSAKKGNAFAQNSLGVMYAKGRGVPQSFAQSVKWYQRAANQGNFRAQYNLAVKYHMGRGIEKNMHEAIKWYRESANQGHMKAQNNLGWLYYLGQGVERNYVHAYKWGSISAARGHPKARRLKTRVEKQLSSEQLEEARQLVRDFVPKKRKPQFALGKSPSDASARKDRIKALLEKLGSDKLLSVSSGSGFAISPDGHVVTNYHVVNGCQNVKIHHEGNVIPTTVVTSDSKSDLALLKGDFKPKTHLSVSKENPQLMQEIYVAGYPFGQRVSSSVKVTKGIVSSLTGFKNNTANIQIDAALNTGNSGGPIIGTNGNVVGVAVAKLSATNKKNKYTSLPEGMNFGIKASMVRSFLESNNIRLSEPNAYPIPTTKLGKLISNSTYYLSCWMTLAQLVKMKTKKKVFKSVK